MTEDALQLGYKGPIDKLHPEARQALVDRGRALPPSVRQQVEVMEAELQAQGDAALRAYTERFDGVELNALRVPARALERAHDAADPAFLEAFGAMVESLQGYHEALAGHPPGLHEAGGLKAYERRVALARVGIYVPGGRAAYPSTVAHTVVPAQAAGVDEVVLASPPGEDGLPHPLVLAACHVLGIEHVVPVGGAQAILALALGTQSVPACQAVVGPGNAWVQAAKQRVAGRVRIDAPAGPSEVAVLLGPSVEPAHAASEMIAQAEHDPDTLAVTVCLKEGTAMLVMDALTTQLEGLPREQIVREALEARGAILVAEDVGEALTFLDELAPEHCILLHEDGPNLARYLDGPACIVTGPRARVPLTDYTAGPSHVLPTGGHARAYSGIDVDTFTKRVHVVEAHDTDPALVEAAIHLARLEGLEGHARALEEGAR